MRYLVFPQANVLPSSLSTGVEIQLSSNLVGMSLTRKVLPTQGCQKFSIGLLLAQFKVVGVSSVEVRPGNKISGWSLWGDEIRLAGTRQSPKKKSAQFP